MNTAWIGCLAFAIMATAPTLAQRTFEKTGHVIYEDAESHQVNLGVGFSPVLTADGKVALIRGRLFHYGEDFDCSHRATRNWIIVYDTATRQEKTIFDRPLDYGIPRAAVCIFEQMQLSHSGSILYLVSPVYATSGSLGIVDLGGGSVRYVPGVNQVYVVEAGPHSDELIYVRRTLHGSDGPRYPFIHASANGKQIAEISNESFTVGGNDKVPLLRKYLRPIDATITVNGRKLP